MILWNPRTKNENRRRFSKRDITITRGHQENMDGKNKTRTRKTNTNLKQLIRMKNQALSVVQYSEKKGTVHNPHWQEKKAFKPYFNEIGPTTCNN